MLTSVMDKPGTAESHELLGALETLIISTVPDKRGIRRILQGLGGGESVPAAPMAAFLTALLSVVYEGE